MLKRGLIFVFIVFLITLVYALNFSDLTQNDFNNGTYVNVSYNGTGVVLSGNNLTGSFTSRVFDAGILSRLNNLNYISSVPTMEYLFSIDNSADVWASNDSGVNWVKVNDDYNNGLENGIKSSFFNSSGSYFAVYLQRVFKSDDFGISWANINDNYNGGEVNNAYASFVDKNNAIYILEGDQDVWESIDFGVSFTKIATNMNGANGNVLGFYINSSNYLFVVDAQSDVWNSADGITWDLIKDDYNNGATNGADGLAIDLNNNLYVLDGQDIWQSNDSGVSWIKVNDDFNGAGDTQAGQAILTDQNNYVYVLDGGEDVFKSTDVGISFTKIATNFNGDGLTSQTFASYIKTTNLSFQVKNCSVADCSDGSWQSLDLDNINLTGRYFQYRANFTSQEAELTPLLYNTSLDYSSFDSVNPLIQFSTSTTENGTAQNIDSIFVNISASDTNLIYSFINFDNSLLAFYKMNETSGDVIDYSGGLGHGLNYGANSTQGKFGNSLEFDGTNDWIRANKDNIYFTNENFTFSFWIYPKGFPASGWTPLSKGSVASYNTPFTFYGISAGQLRFYTGNATCTGWELDGNAQSFRTNVLPLNQWQLITVTKSGNNYSFYQNAILIKSVTTSSDFICSDSTGYNLTIGGSRTGAYKVNGSIDEVLVFNRALSSDEISSLYGASSYSKNFTDLEEGTHNFSAYVQDVAGNENLTDVRVVVISSNTPPIISIINPVNNSIYSYGSIEVNYTLSDLEDNVQSCWYNLDSQANVSIACENNFSLNVSEGQHSLIIFANDSLGESSSSSVLFFVDSLSPLINLIFPQNISYNYGVSELNYSILDDNLQSCWYSLNNGLTNDSVTCGQNISFLDSNQGNNTWKVWANDSAGNINSSEVTFFVDSIQPSLSIMHPQEGSSYGYNESIILSYSVFDSNLQACWYNLGAENTTIESCLNTTFNVSGNGDYAIFLYANDSLGNENFDYSSFSVNLGAPTISLLSPIDLYLDYQNITFAYIPEDIDLDTCELWGNFDGEFKLNQSQISANEYENYFYLNLSDGTYVWNIKCNDSQGNFAFNGNQTFYVDTTSPKIRIISPVGGISSNNVTFSFHFNDTTPLSYCSYNVTTSGGGTIVTDNSINCNSPLEYQTISDGVGYVLNIFANDSAGNSNTSSSGFSVSTTSSSSSSSGGGSSSSSSGGGAGAPRKINLEASKISDLTISQGGVKKVNSWRVKNTGTSFLNDCKFKSQGDKASWIPYTETKGLAAGEEYEFVFDINIPESAGAGEHKLEVFLDCNEVNETGEFVVEILGKQLEFTITNVERQANDEVGVGYTLENLVDSDQNVDLQFLLFDSDKKQVAETTKSVAIPAKDKQDFETIIPIDENLQGELSLLINVNSETYSTFVQENIILGKTIGGFAIFGNAGTRDKMISGLIVLLFLGFTFVMIRKIRGHHKIIRHEHLKKKYAFLYNAEF